MINFTSLRRLRLRISRKGDHLRGRVDSEYGAGRADTAIVYHKLAVDITV